VAQMMIEAAAKRDLHNGGKRERENDGAEKKR
jgi:hypothetical protein